MPQSDSRATSTRAAKASESAQAPTARMLYKTAETSRLTNVCVCQCTVYPEPNKVRSTSDLKCLGSIGQGGDALFSYSLSHSTDF